MEGKKEQQQHNDNKWIARLNDGKWEGCRERFFLSCCSVEWDYCESFFLYHHHHPSSCNVFNMFKCNFHRDMSEGGWERVIQAVCILYLICVPFNIIHKKKNIFQKLNLFALNNVSLIKFERMNGNRIFCRVPKIEHTFCTFFDWHDDVNCDFLIFNLFDFVSCEILKIFTKQYFLKSKIGSDVTLMNSMLKTHLLSNINENKKLIPHGIHCFTMYSDAL